MEQLIIDGTALRGVFMVEKPGIVLAPQRVTWIALAGVDWRIPRNEGLDHVQVKMKLYVMPDRDMERVAAALANAAAVAVSGTGLEWHVLAFDTAASFVDWMEMPDGGKEGTVTWRCDPYRYHTDVREIVMTTIGRIENPGTASALPRIEVYGDGDMTLMIGRSTIMLYGVDDKVTIDCASKTCVDVNGDSFTRSMVVEGGWPVLEPGTNMVNQFVGVRRIEVLPRWRNR